MLTSEKGSDIIHDMTQTTKTPSKPNKKIQNWTEDFIKKYKPALKELSKK